MLYKIATHKEPEYLEFEYYMEQEHYWAEICRVCHDKDCDGLCVILIPGRFECGDCWGEGRIKFLMNRNMPDEYYVITVCGMCEGLGRN